MNFPELTEAVTLRNGVPTTTSLKIAEIFGKEHRSVIRSIENLEIPEEISLHNFALTSFQVPQPNGGTRDVKAYLITRDGFTLLAMGFTGKRAMQFKLAYIQAFNELERRGRESGVSLDAVVSRLERLEKKIDDLAFDRFLDICEKVMNHPTAEDVNTYLAKFVFPEIGEEFCRWYSRHDWCDRHGDPIRDWKSCATAWVFRKQQHMIQNSAKIAKANRKGGRK